MLETITGKNTYTIYDNGEGYTVCKFQLDTGKTVTVAGTVSATRDLKIMCYGTWDFNERYGHQFKSQRYEAVKPSDEKGVVAYLTSLKCGIGKVWGKRIYKNFREETWDILEKEPDKLLEIKGFGAKRLERLTQSVAETKAVRDVMSIFAGVMDMPMSKAEMICKRFGKDAVDIIQNKPYNLIVIKGLGFKTVELIGKQFNGNPQDSMRIRGAIYYTIENAEARGSTCMAKATLVDKVYRLLNHDYAKNTVPEAVCKKEIQAMVLEGKLYSQKYVYNNTEKELIYRIESYKAEQAIAENLYRISTGTQRIFSEAEINRELKEYSKSNNFKLAEIQKEAIKEALMNNATVITGGPGTGKTTITKTLVSVYKKLYKGEPKIILMAPTGRASRRLAESTGHPAATIHSQLGYFPNEAGGGYTTVKELDADLIVVDETSMVDQYIMNLLLKAVQSHTKIVFIGDAHQLPSVGSGNVFADIIKSQSIPVVRLKVVFRQKETSPIVKNSLAILKGDTNLDFNSKGFFFNEVNDDRNLLVSACKFYISCVHKYGMDNVALLTPFREKTPVSVNAFNKQLQNYFNPKQEGTLSLKVRDVEFRKGDRIMQTKNTAHAMNGDVGYIKDIVYAFDTKDEQNFTTVCQVEFNNDGNVLTYTKDDMKNVMLAYAMTVHKSQGSEYQTVIFVCSKSHEALLNNPLVYTAITRASENLAILGQKPALDMAIENSNVEMRVTYLKKRIRSAFGENMPQSKGKITKEGEKSNAEQLRIA